MEKRSFSGKLIWPILIVLVVAVLVLANMTRSAVEVAEGRVAVTHGGEVIREFTLKDIKELPSIKVKKTIQSGSRGNETGIFTGVSLDVLINSADPALLSKGRQVITRASDGFVSAFAMNEVTADDNILLVYAKDGKALDQDSGPFRIVIQKDVFGNRSTRLLHEVEIK